MVANWFHNATMPSITLKQVPPQLVECIKERARLTGRSMNKEIIACLEMVVMPRERSAEERIAERKVLWESVDLQDLGSYDPNWKNLGRK